MGIEAILIPDSAIYFISRFALPSIEEALFSSQSSQEHLNSGLRAIFLIILIPVLILLFFIIKFLYTHTIGKKLKTTLLEDYKREAEGYERGGRYVSAASIYESKLKDPGRAAALYEKGNDYRSAASLYDTLGMAGKAKEMYEKDADPESAAEVSVRAGDYEEAARLYERAGKKLDAALFLEKLGKRIESAKAYKEAGEHRKAALLLEEEGMQREAAEIFGLSLSGKKVDDSNAADFYDYARMLEKIGANDMAIDIYREIDIFDAAFKDVGERLQTLVRSSGKEDDLEGKTRLRSFIRNGKIEPKYCLKLWVQILKSLQEAYNGGRPYGLLSPETIAIDSRNNISFHGVFPSSSYAAPETLKGAGPDERADIYSMGIILYEMLTGSLEGLGSRRVIDTAEDVPYWLDEIVIRCIKKVKEDRYQGISDVFADLKALSKGRKERDV